MDSYVLLAVALVFALYIVFRFRPVLSNGKQRGAARAALRDAKARLDTAKTDEARALCLGDAADASARAGLVNGAVGYYMRAMRLAPRSAAMIDRAASELADHPRALETLLWRRLGAEPWTGETGPAAHAALNYLARTYARGALRQSVRARAFHNALRAMAPDKAAELDQEGLANDARDSELPSQPAPAVAPSERSS